MDILNVKHFTDQLRLSVGGTISVYFICFHFLYGFFHVAGNITKLLQRSK